MRRGRVTKATVVQAPTTSSVALPSAAAVAPSPAKPETSPYVEIGTTGLQRMRGIIFEEFLRELQGDKGRKVYREMATDGVLAGMLLAIEMLARKAGHTVEAASTNVEDERAKQFVEECRDDMSSTWSDLISENLSMLVYGWSYHEVVFKRRLGPDPMGGLAPSRFNDGKIGWRKIPIRAQESLLEWVIDDADGGVQGMKQLGPDMKPREIPIERALLFRTSVHKGSPEGRSILRSAYKPWWFKHNIQNIEAIGVERDLAGIPIALVPPEIMTDAASPKQKAVYAKIRQIVINLRRDEQEGVVFPNELDENGKSRYELKLLSTAGQRQFDTSKIIGRYNTEMLISALADFILLGHEQVGSYALSVDKTEIFAAALEAWLDSIDDVYNRYAIPRLFALNGWRLERLPKLKHGRVDRVDLVELGNFISALSGAGMELFPDRKLEAHIRELGGLPEGPTAMERARALGVFQTGQSPPSANQPPSSANGGAGEAKPAPPTNGAAGAPVA